MKTQRTSPVATCPTYQFISPFRAFIDLLKGHTLLRSYFHFALRQTGIKLSGTVIDLGGKQSNCEYHRLLLGTDAKLICTDFHPAAGVIAVDVESLLPFATGSADAVLAFHLFEHVFNLDKVAPEVFRILRPGGVVLISAPFLHRYHGDISSSETYDDYWRFSHSCLKRWWENAGFECQSIVALGEGMFSSSLIRSVYSLTPPWFGTRRLVSAVSYLIGTCVDRLASFRPEYGKRVNPVVFAEGFFAAFNKPVR